MTRSLLIALLILSSLVHGHAGLEFADKKIELKATPSDEILTAEFTFKNTGDTPVDITKIDVGCSCLSGTTDKEFYKPGESGKLDVFFKLGSFTGYQEKGLTVITGSERIQLKVGVQIPNVITITPDIAEWFIGGKPEPKTFKILVEHPKPINILEVVSSRKEFDFELRTVKEGREYEIELTPKSLDKGMLGMLRIKTDCLIKKHQRQMAFFAVSRPKSEAKGKGK